MLRRGLGDAEVDQRKALGAAAPDLLQRPEPGLDVDLGRRGRGQDVTTGNETTRTIRLWRIGRTNRVRAWGRTARRSNVIGAPSARSGAATSISSMCWTMWTEKSVVS